MKSEPGILGEIKYHHDYYFYCNALYFKVSTVEEFWQNIYCPVGKVHKKTSFYVTGLVVTNEMGDARIYS